MTNLTASRRQKKGADRRVRQSEVDEALELPQSYWYNNFGRKSELNAIKKPLKRSIII